MGGTHGGGGGFGDSSSLAAAKSYGDVEKPTELGSGGQMGRYKYSNSAYYKYGGAGGGAIAISVDSGALKLDGDASILANGEAGEDGITANDYYGQFCGGGGGSGGSVMINASKVVGSGVIEAKGGAGGKGGIRYGSPMYAGGGGGGGRVAIRASSLDSNVTISAFGGAGGKNNPSSATSKSGLGELEGWFESVYPRAAVPKMPLQGCLPLACAGCYGLHELIAVAAAPSPFCISLSSSVAAVGAASVLSIDHSSVGWCVPAFVRCGRVCADCAGRLQNAASRQQPT